MRDIRSNKKINIHKNNPASIGRFKQRSNSTLILDLYDEFSNYVDLSNQEISIRVERPDGITFEQIDNITKNSNVLTVKLKNEVLEVEGKCRVELNLKDSEGQMNTADFFFEVGESVLNDDIVLSSDSYESLEKALVVFRTESNSLMKKLDDNEKVRISNENKRKSQETNRVNVENTRNSKENERISQENTRKSQEEDRKTNENTRKSQENTRQENENIRKSQETSRINKENERKTNEDARKASESDRQTRFSKLENDGKKLITEMNTAIDGTITREVTEARGAKAKLGIRLNDMEQQSSQNTNRIEQLEDLTPVWQEHEGTGNITINDSFDGITKDLVVKGKTLKNEVDRKGTQLLVLEGDNYVNPENNIGGGLLLITPTIKENTVYTLIYKVSKNSKNVVLKFDGHQNYVAKPKNLNSTVGYHKVAFSTIDSFANASKDRTIKIQIWVEDPTGEKGTISIHKDVMVIEGDYTDKPIPSTYFDSITSVGELEDNKIKIKSIGKNLWSNNNANPEITGDKFKLVGTNKIEIDMSKTGWHSANDLILDLSHLPYDQYTIIYKCKQSDNIYKPRLSFRYADGTSSGTSNNELEFSYREVSDKKRKVVGISLRWWNSTNDTKVTFDEICLYVGDTIATNYEDYREYIKEINIPFDGGLKSLPNGVADEINYSKIIQSVGKIVLNGGENWAVLSDKVTESTLLFRYAMPNTIKLNNGETGRELTCDRFNPDSGYDVYNGINNNEGISIANSGNLFIRILKSKLSTQDVAGFKAWLQQNPTTLYYELNEPIVHRLNQDINLVTFGTTTHIMQKNNIISDISFKAKVSLSSQAKRLTEENRILKEENVILKESSIKTTEEQEIQDQKITTTMLANTELFEMMLDFMPMKLDDKQFRGGEMNMVEVYVTLIIQGDKTLEQVPTIIRPKVEAKLRLLGVMA